MRFLVAAVIGTIAGSAALADEPVSLKNVKAPAENKKDEPAIGKFSLDKATHFLDSAALSWTQKQGCFTCHTNYAYLYARPHLAGPAPAHAEVRAALEEMVTKRWPDKGPRWDAEVVASAAALAYNDSLTTKKLHPVTRTALDKMWDVQKKDGGFSWLKCAWPPMENDDHYGVTLAAIAVGVAPDGYAKSDAARRGLDGIRKWLQANPPQNLHHKAMLLWANTYLDGFVTDDGKKETIKELRAVQLKDGGWSAASLGAWKRADKLEQDPGTSDGYGTGFVVFVLKSAGVPANDPAVDRGVAWLKANQRESGRWFTRSLNRDNKHYLSHAGTAFAVMALAGGADQPATLKSFKPPSKNTKDEPLASQFSPDRAAQFLDVAALNWTKTHGCFSCHSNLSYLYARPHLDGPAPAHADVRLALEELVSKRWPEKGPRWDTEVVVAAAALAYNDSLTTRKLHPLTRTALDRMWTVQRKDGGFSWYKCNLPPMEIDDHYGATLAAVATGVAPEGYAKTDAARKGLDGLRAYLQANPPQNLHHKAMTLWAASFVEDFWTDDGKKAAIKELLAAQLPDGGWSAASLGAWKRADKLEQDPKTSDGYGTGFATFTLRRAGVPANDPALQKAVAWLKANQRASGRWFTRSLSRDDTHYLTDAGSAFAVLALAACDPCKPAAANVE